MAQPARQPVPGPSQDPPLDPDAIHRAYRYHRARRNARSRRQRERTYAGLRFFIAFAVLLGLAIFLLLTLWHEVQKVFGL